MPSELSRLGKRLPIALAAATLFGVLALAQTLPSGVQKGSTIAGVTEYDYPNGLKALLLPDSGSSSITINVTYLVGSRHEGYGETGMAHLLEHMNFIKSTHDRNIKKELEDHGALLERHDRLRPHQLLRNGQCVGAENLRWALGLEAERMVNMRDRERFARHGDDGRPQRVRARREQRRPKCSKSVCSRPRLLWHNYGKSTIGIARRHRTRPHRLPRRLLSQVPPAG